MISPLDREDEGRKTCPENLPFAPHETFAFTKVCNEGVGAGALSVFLGAEALQDTSRFLRGAASPAPPNTCDYPCAEIIACVSIKDEQ